MAGVSSVGVSRVAGKLLALDAKPAVKIGVIGVFQRGTIGRAVECASWQAWQDEFGLYDSNAQAGPLAVKTLFEEAKSDGNGAAAPVLVYGVRVVHSSTPSNIATKTSVAASVILQTDTLAATGGTVSSDVGPWELVHGYNLIIAFNLGGNQTFTISAVAAARETTNSEAFGLADLEALTVKIDRGSVQTITFHTAAFVDIANATAEEVGAEINAQLVGGRATVTSGGTKVTISSDRKGTGSYVEVTGGTANGGLNFATAEVQGTGNVSDVLNVTAAEWVTIMSAITNGSAVNDGGALKLTSTTTGTGGSAQVTASSTADTAMGFDNAVHTGTAGGALDTLQVDAISDGAWANPFNIKIAAASNGQSDQFNLQVLNGTVIVETYTNLSMTDTDANYVESVINSGVGSQPASKYIVVTDLAAALDSPDDLPVAGTFGLDDDTTGADGLGSLADADYVGGLTSGKTAGLSCFDRLNDLDIIIAPDRATSSFLNSLITYNNSRSRKAFLILEPPSSQSIAQIRTFVRTTAALIGSTERAATYYPQTKVDNPDATIFGNAATVVAPVSGQIAGLYARVAAARDFGAFTSPAGKPLKLRTARALVNTDIEDPTNRGLVFDDRINPITTDLEQGGIYVDGARTLNATGAFPFVGESRGITFLEIQIGNALDPHRHENNTQALRSALKTEIEIFLRRGLPVKAYATDVEKDAFTVDASDALNPPSEQAAGRLHINVGVATAKPAEFILLQFAPK